MLNTMIMMKLLYNILLTLILLINLMTLNIDSPLIIWILMEFSNLMFLILCTTQSPTPKSTPIIFMMQFTSSMIILIPLMIKSTHISIPLMSLALMMKIGLYPFDLWMYATMMSIKWTLCLMFLTIMKIPPFMFASTITMSTVMYMSLSISPIVSLIKSINMTSTKMIIVPSSIIHSSWMTLIIFISHQMWLFYFTIYSLNMICIILMIKSSFSQKISIHTISNKENIDNISMITLIFSMMMIPPMSAFSAKFKAMEYISSWIYSIPCISLIISSSLSIVIYTRIFLMSMMMSFNNIKKINTKYKNLMIMNILIIPAQTLIWMMIF